MKKEYDFRSIEPKWQHYWRAQGSFRALNPGDPGFDPAQPKYYVLGMFPYPSGSGLHVGHPLSYTAVDILARYKRMRGFNVLNPIGWDSFGLPAEQFAVKTGFSPQALTIDSINTFRRQLMALGFSYDWEREVATSNPSYFRWTQWIFLQLHRAGLAVELEAPVWWCERLGTVLANEEVSEEGKSEVGGHPCVRVPLKQWFLRITEYADRLDADLAGLQWPEGIKELQHNWIGRSVGAEIAFALEGEEGQPGQPGQPEGQPAEIAVFTTRPDTLHGCTFMLLAPEHPLAGQLATPAQAAAVAAYIDAARRQSEIQRQAKAGKTGIFTGAYCLNPANGERVPVWISDYVLASYGTGAVMGVPAHDERDFDFAVEKGIPIREVVQPPTPDHKDIVRALDTPVGRRICFIGDGVGVNSGPLDGLPTPQAKERCVEILAAAGKAKAVVRYKLRDWLFSRQRYWGEPIPLVHHADGTITPVPETELPVLLPPTGRFEPSGEPTPPLALDAEWSAYPLPGGGHATREPNVMPQWAGSCWYYLRFLDPHNDQAFCAPEVERYWMPVDMYIGGAEHAVLHLLYARFWHKCLYDQGLVSHPEPFAGLFNQGMIQGEAYRNAAGQLFAPGKVRFADGKAFDPDTGEELTRQIVKMSKSLGNIVNPDEVVQEHGADALRLYIVSMGPLEKNKPWDTRSIMGAVRFIHRLWALVVGEADSAHETPSRPHLLTDTHPRDAEVERALHKAIAAVTADIEAMRFHTAVSQLIIFVNLLGGDAHRLCRDQAERLIKLCAPFAPHLAEELWLRLAHTEPLAQAPWPSFDPAQVVETEVTLAVQVNGRLRATISLPAAASEAVALARAREALAGSPHLAGKEPAKVIYVPGKILNLVVK